MSQEMIEPEEKYTRKANGGHNAIPCKWNGETFKSLADLDNYLGLSSGYARVYYNSQRPLKGHYIESAGKQIRKYTDNDLAAFYSYVNARRDIMAKVGLKGMVKQFAENRKIIN